MLFFVYSDRCLCIFIFDLFLHTVPLPGMSLEGLLKDYQDLHHQQQQQQQQQHLQYCPFCRESFDLGSLKEHLDGGCRARPSSPPSTTVAIAGQYGCLQCNAAFGNRDLLEKHELLHSPNAQVVSTYNLLFYTILSNYLLLDIQYRYIYYI
jgi:hypothetical protein